MRSLTFSLLIATSLRGRRKLWTNDGEKNKNGARRRTDNSKVFSPWSRVFVTSVRKRKRSVRKSVALQRKDPVSKSPSHSSHVFTFSQPHKTSWTSCSNCGNHSRR